MGAIAKRSVGIAFPMLGYGCDRISGILGYESDRFLGVMGDVRSHF
jgi:hypothetical protein